MKAIEKAGAIFLGSGSRLLIQFLPTLMLMVIAWFYAPRPPDPAATVYPARAIFELVIWNAWLPSLGWKIGIALHDRPTFHWLRPSAENPDALREIRRAFVGGVFAYLFVLVGR